MRNALKMFLVAVMLAAPCVVFAAGPYNNSATFSGQGLIADGFGGYDLITELCGVANGADVDGPYLLWVLTATGSNNADITGPWGTAAMTKFGNGTFKYISGWYNPSTLSPGVVQATYDGKAKNAQLVVSHGCRPFTKGAWCSPGFWGHAQSAAWTLIGHSSSETFNLTVVPDFYANALADDPTLLTVLTATGGTYKSGAAGAAAPFGLNAFNAAGAYLSDQIPGYHFDPALVGGNESDTCPIDNHGNWK